MYAFYRHIREGKTTKIVLLAIFISLASVLQLFEGVIFPMLYPFKAGLSNIFVLLSIAIYGPWEAIIVVICKSMLTSIMGGKLFSIPFFLSLGGGIASTLVMGGTYRRFEELSVIGVSILGATCHNFVQMLILFYLIPNKAILRLLPWLWLLALVSGIAIGIVTQKVLEVKTFKTMVKE